MSEGDPAEDVGLTIVERRSGWQLIDLAELWKYADLLRFFVLRDTQVRYRQTVLGFVWAIIQPFFSMIVFAVIFGGLAKMPSDGTPYPVFSYVALVPWTYFARALAQSTNSLIQHAGMLNRVYFPRLLLPITPVLSSLLDFVIAFGFVGVLMAYYGIAPTAGVVVLPLLILLMVMTALGAGMFLSSIALQYRDVPFVVSFMVQVLMYMAPVVWPVSLIPDEYRLVYGLYPMVGVIEGFRAAMLGSVPMPWDLIGMGSMTAVVLLIVGALVFRRKEQMFADVA